MPPKGSRANAASQDEYLSLSAEWKAAKLFSKLPPIEWRTCDVSTKCCNGAWFKVRTDCLLEATAKIVKRKDGIQGYLPEVMERQVCCRLCNPGAPELDPGTSKACDWCVEQEVLNGNESPLDCIPSHHAQDSWRSTAEWSNASEAGTDLPCNTQVRVRMKVMPGNNPYREWHMRCPDCQEELIVDRVGQPYIHSPGLSKENRAQASDLLRHMGGLNAEGTWRCRTWANYVSRNIQGGEEEEASTAPDCAAETGVGAARTSSGSVKKRTVAVHPTEKLLATWRNTSRSLAMQALDLLQREVATELLATSSDGTISSSGPPPTPNTAPSTTNPATVNATGSAQGADLDMADAAQGADAAAAHWASIVPAGQSPAVVADLKRHATEVLEVFKKRSANAGADGQPRKRARTSAAAAAAVTGMGAGGGSHSRTVSGQLAAGVGGAAVAGAGAVNANGASHAGAGAQASRGALNPHSAGLSRLGSEAAGLGLQEGKGLTDLPSGQGLCSIHTHVAPGIPPKPAAASQPQQQQYQAPQLDGGSGAAAFKLLALLQQAGSVSASEQVQGPLKLRLLGKLPRTSSAAAAAEAVGSAGATGATAGTSAGALGSSALPGSGLGTARGQDRGAGAGTGTDGGGAGVDGAGGGMVLGGGEDGPEDGAGDCDVLSLAAVAECIATLYEQLATAQAEVQRQAARIAELESSRLLGTGNLNGPSSAAVAAGGVAGSSAPPASTQVPRQIARLQAQLSASHAEVNRLQRVEEQLAHAAEQCRSLQLQVLNCRRETLEAQSAMRQVLLTIGALEEEEVEVARAAQVQQLRMQQQQGQQ